MANALISAFHFGGPAVPAPAPAPAPAPVSPLIAAFHFTPAPVPAPAAAPAVEGAARGGPSAPWPLTFDAATIAKRQAELSAARADGRVREFMAPIGPGGAAQQVVKIMLPFAGTSPATGKRMPDPAKFPFPAGYPIPGDWTVPLDAFIPNADNGKRYGGASDAQWRWISDRKRAIWGTGKAPADDYGGVAAEALMSAKERALLAADRYHSDKGLRALTDVVGGVVISSVAAVAVVGAASAIAAGGSAAAAGGGGGSAAATTGGSAATAAGGGGAAATGGGAAAAGGGGLSAGGLSVGGAATAAAGAATKLKPLLGVLSKGDAGGSAPAAGMPGVAGYGNMPGAGPAFPVTGGAAGAFDGRSLLERLIDWLSSLFR